MHALSVVLYARMLADGSKISVIGRLELASYVESAASCRRECKTSSTRRTFERYRKLLAGPDTRAYPILNL